MDFTPGWCPFCNSPISFRCNDDCFRKALAWLKELYDANRELNNKVHGLEDEVKVAFALKPPVQVQCFPAASSEAPKTTKGELPVPEKPRTTRGEWCGIFEKPTE